MLSVKGHYYGPTIYSFPYTFGLLIGLGIHANYQKGPDGVRADYDDFLSSTGMADVVTLGKRFGADEHSVEFWRSSMDFIWRHIVEFNGW